MTRIVLSLILISTVAGLLPLPVSAIILVPCGRSEAPGNEPCQLQHLVILIIRLVNYLITTAAIVAMYQILLSGFNLTTALGNTEKIEKAKAGLSHAVVGFAMIILAFVFVNLLVNGIFGKPNASREWWRPECIYSIGESGQCPLGITEGRTNP